MGMGAGPGARKSSLMMSFETWAECPPRPSFRISSLRLKVYSQVARFFFLHNALQAAFAFLSVISEETSLCREMMADDGKCL